MIKPVASIFCVAAFAIAMFAGSGAEALNCYYEGGSIEILICMP